MEGHLPDSLTEAALGRGALYWDWRVTPWGVVFEVAFRDEEAWGVFASCLQSAPLWTPCRTRSTDC
jgi:hypothetical protein